MIVGIIIVDVLYQNYHRKTQLVIARKVLSLHVVVTRLYVVMRSQHFVNIHITPYNIVYKEEGIVTGIRRRFVIARTILSGEGEGVVSQYLLPLTLLVGATTHCFLVMDTWLLVDMHMILTVSHPIHQYQVVDLLLEGTVVGIHSKSIQAWYQLSLFSQDRLFEFE